MNYLGFKRVLGYCGACIAFYIGAGFATMQEVMQYEVSYGSKFGIVIAVTALIYIQIFLSQIMVADIKQKMEEQFIGYIAENI